MRTYTHTCTAVHTYIRTYIHTNIVHTYIHAGPSPSASGVYSVPEVPQLGPILEMDFQVERIRDIPL